MARWGSFKYGDGGSVEGTLLFDRLLAGGKQCAPVIESGRWFMSLSTVGSGACRSAALLTTFNDFVIVI